MKQTLIKNIMVLNKEKILFDACKPSSDDGVHLAREMRLKQSGGYIEIAEIGDKEFSNFNLLFERLNFTLQLLEQRISFAVVLNDVEELLGESLLVRFGIRLD